MQGLPAAGWLSGFLAGLDAVGERKPAWRWSSFLDDMDELIVTLGVAQATPPGDTPPMGTVLSALGGYISASGDVREGHLRIPIPFMRGDTIKELLQCAGTEVHAKSIHIPFSCLHQLLSRVTLDGPLLELLEEEEVVG